MKQTLINNIKFSNLVYVICFSLAILCYYFSISDSIFPWLFPDEIVASSFYDNYGFLGCVKHYYVHTTIYRLAGDLGICSMAKTVGLFKTPYLGWNFARLFFYALIPASLSFLIKRITTISSKYATLSALIVSTIVLYIISDVAIISGDEGFVANMYGLDLAMYALATCTFFMLIGAMSESLEKSHCFTLLCIIYLLNLNSLETFLVISAFIIPIYAWCKYDYTRQRFFPDSKGFIKFSLHDKQVRVLVILYSLSVLITLLAPSLKNRLQIYPANGNLVDSLIYILLAIEETLFFIFNYKILLAMTFGCGLFVGLFYKNTPQVKNNLLIKFLFFAPVMYLVVTAFLMGRTPNLWGTSARIGNYKILESLFAYRDVFAHGELGLRQNLFLYLMIFFDVFILGYLATGLIKKRFSRVENNNKLPILNACMLTIITCLFLTHPEGIGSLNVMFALPKKINSSNAYAPSESVRVISALSKAEYTAPASKTEGSILALITNVPDEHAIKNIIFPKISHATNHHDAIVNMDLNNYLHNNRGKTVPYCTLIGEKAWVDNSLSMYDIRALEP